MLFQLSAMSQNNKIVPLVHQSIQASANQMADQLVQIRRSFHQHPELAGKEQQTQAFLQKHLVNLGLEVITQTNGYGIIGVLKTGKKGKKIAWRADMDALPNDFPDPVDFKSTQAGVQHGCGHDIHMTIALGMAQVLAKNKDQLSGSFYFIFQAEEETFVGAKKLLDNQIAQLHLDEIYGLHVTAMTAGQIMVKPNEIFAYQKRVQLRFNKILDKEAIQEISQLLDAGLSRSMTNSKPWEMQQILDPKIGLSNDKTIFQDYCFLNQPYSAYSEKEEQILATDLYETNAQKIPLIIPQIKKILAASKYGSNLGAVSFIQENSTVNNDPKLTGKAIQTLDQIYGKDFVVKAYGQVPFFNDDFAFYQQKIPGVYFLFGGSNFEKGWIAMNHAPNFMVDESCLLSGVKYFSSLLVERAKPTL
ncbi:MAG: amidohydrolase [Chitinophagaceae bacterium BSSC1]|nr:MAG: amidohydrolase [Chitinophagaceae bacterium BSSC1]